jgi:hypothetical protein
MQKLTTYEGVVENGHVTLPPNVAIPDQTRVYVLVPDVETQRTFYVRSPRLVHPEQAKDFEMKVIENSTDADV